MGSCSTVRKRYYLKLLIVMCMVYFLAQESCVWASGSDKSALLEFKASVLDPSGVLSSWDSVNSDHCSWYGVACDPNHLVVALNITGGSGGDSLSSSCSRISQFPLYGYGIRRSCLNGKPSISGKLSSSIAKLSDLRILSLPYNDLSGEIPVEMWEMGRLEVLDLEGNLISGSLPVQFNGLRNLRVLNLGFNGMVGYIPDSFSSCTALQMVNLAGNHLNGSIPRFIGRLRDLKGLYLSFNQLTGAIPVDIGLDCRKLEYLELSGNYLTEGIPSSLGNCTGLRSLLLYSNLLVEGIPAELGRLTQLEVLDLSRNCLSGAIPPEIANCSNLSILVLSNLWDPLPHISRLNDTVLSGEPVMTDEEFNFYEGTIPSEITSISSLRMLWVPRATLDGKLPAWINCDNLEMVNLASNFYTGGISDQFSYCKNLHHLDLSSNKLTGELVEKLSVPCMTLFDVSGNSLSGPIPKFLHDSCSSVLPAFGDTSDLSSSYLLYFTRKSQMDKIFGEPYEDNGSLIVIHIFSGNNFTGTLQSLPIAPARIHKQTVYALSVASNKLSGPFPGGLFNGCGELSSLIVNISKNMLAGQIPGDIGANCSALRVFDASWNQIVGPIPPSIGNLVSLVALNLSWNLLQAPLPTSVGQLKDLKFLSLSGNNLIGSIPASMSLLNSLEVLDLSSNSLTGEIPKDLVNLKNLTVLLLNNNNLSGQIPSGLAGIVRLSAFNVSFNNLSGPIPSNDSLIKCSSVLGNPHIGSCHMTSQPSMGQQGLIVDPQNYHASPSSTPAPVGGSGRLNSIEIASISSAAAIFSVLLLLLAIFFYTRKCSPRSRVGGSTRKEVTVFTDIGAPLTFENVVCATANFNASNCIGNGGFGATYKAEIAPGILVAIKRLAVGRFQGVQQFDAEIKTLGRLRHPNLVTLVGYHASNTEMFLIYNYLPGGNLEKFIQERSTRAVDWRVLHKIAHDIARALAYLHEQCVPRVIHRDVKPSNILLDEDYNAYLSDFGLARLLGTSETHATTGVAGTFGYVAPEYATTCRVSDKADVYSYGVVLLELISDKKALDPSFSPYGNGFNIVAWACMLMRQGRSKEFFTSGLWEAGPHDDLVEVLHLAIVCTVNTLSNRPTMKQVVKRLKQLQPPSC